MLIVVFERSEHKSEELMEAALRLVLVCSVKCEQNRVALIQNGILTSLVECMTSGPLVIRVCKVWIALVQDDDVRVPFGKATRTRGRSWRIMTL